MLVIIENKEYELIWFKSKLTNQTVQMCGYAFARNYLAVSGSDHNYRIYNTLSGEPIIRGRFLELKEVLKFAQILETMYQNWFDIWEAYPKADLISWCKYSVDDGAKMFEMVEILDELETISHNDVIEAYKQAKILAERWKV
jgi:hypothetical protein